MENIVTMIQSYIQPELFVLVPVLWFAGMGLKYCERINNKFIPMFLGAAGVFLCMIYTIANTNAVTLQSSMLVIFTSIVQGILCAGGAVYIDQLIKQSKE